MMSGHRRERRSREQGVLDDLPDDIEVLQDMLRGVRMQLRKARLELDVRQAALGIVKKARTPTRSC